MALRVGLNLFPLTRRAGGIGKFVLSMLRAWPGTRDGVELVAYTFPHQRRLLEGEPWNLEQRPLLSPRLLRRAAADCDLYYCPLGRLTPARTSCPSVVLVMDIQEFFLPGHFTRGERRRRMLALNRAFRHASRIITISAFCRQSMVETLGADPNRIDVIPLCPLLGKGQATPLNRHALPDTPFLLYPAIDWRHKNHVRLFEAFARVRAEHPELKLVLTGTRLASSGLQAAMRNAGTAEAVVDLGHVSEPELRWLYANARGLVFPSLFEGFGLPVVEAMQAGCPVACSQTTSLPEVAGDAALFFDPLDPEAMAASMRQLLAGGPAIEKLVAEGKRHAASFSMDRVIRQHVEVFKKAAAAGPPPGQAPLIKRRNAWLGRITDPGTRNQTQSGMQASYSSSSSSSSST